MESADAHQALLSFSPLSRSHICSQFENNSMAQWRRHSAPRFSTTIVVAEPSIRGSKRYEPPKSADDPQYHDEIESDLVSQQAADGDVRLLERCDEETQSKPAASESTTTVAQMRSSSFFADPPNKT
jgi:hypothetical protein